MAMRQAGEPTVDEILASIKKVMERDNRDAALAERVRRETRGIAQPPEPADGDEADEVLDLGAVGSELYVEDIEDAQDGDDFDGDPAAREGLTNENAADAMRQSLAALAILSEPSAPPQIVRSGETSLEGLVREMLRPMMAQWLDAHLPDIVERLVKAEISRIAGKKR